MVHRGEALTVRAVLDGSVGVQPHARHARGDALMDKITREDLRAAAALAIEMHEAGQVTINPETGTTSWTDLR